MRLLNYLTAAFWNRWNVLALAAGAGVAVISGRPDILAPLVLAAEVAYLGLLGTHPRFQQAVDARQHAQRRQQGQSTATQTLRQILLALPRESLARFERLQQQCRDLSQIARDLKRSQHLEGGPPLESWQLAGLDRLLWIFLRLLFTQFSLGRFLERTNRRNIQDEITQIEARLARLPQENPGEFDQKVRRTLEDNLQTCRERLANYDRARANHELVGLELDRLQSKIQSLAELAVHRQDPDFISGQVDQVAGSMLETEKTMNELRFATGLGPLDDEAPPLLQAQTTEAAS